MIDQFMRSPSLSQRIPEDPIEKNVENHLSQKENKVEKKVKKKENQKVVYLTFDDGPSKWTKDILDVLKEYEIQGTFFMQGIHLEQAAYQADVIRATEEGNYVGAHSMTHDNTILYKNKQFVPEMKETLKLIHDITGTSPQLIRPPYGSIPGLKDDDILQQIIEEEMKVWDWTIESLDWKYQNDPKMIMKNIEDGTKNNIEVVLLHEKETTLKLLPEIITFFKNEGYSFGVYSDDAHFPCNFLSNNQL
ncbi:polysaccharide deacetylase [Bacillus sp. Bva_UNVM-123]|uniref:polysaccharide deacetylase family protein n=1 Tax=Bacillus sp. Bva_UNVM-123 TaxID=2829798 RepID=UPI00391F295A